MQKNPTTLITGAGKRIGAHIATHLAARGHNLVLHYHHSKLEAAALAKDLSAQHGILTTLVQANLTDTESLTHFWNGLPPVSTIIHNAARFRRDHFTTFTAADLRAHLAINFEAPLLLSQGFLRQLPTHASGNMMLLGDGTRGWSISPEFFSYAVSKFSWESIIDLLAAGLAPVARANVIALGPTLSGEVDDDAMFARLAEKAPLHRQNAPAEVCTAIDFLLASPGVTGQVISLANGLNLSTNRP